MPYFSMADLFIGFFISLAATLLLTYPVKQLALKIGAMDVPDHRKIHTTVTPRLGGLAIFLGTALGLLYLQPIHENFTTICIGAVIIIITGILDDKYQIRPLAKLTGQLLAAGVLIYSGVIIEYINIPFFGVVPLGYFSAILTLLWIVGITNAINLIDGLDGLASGVTTIALTSILVMALIDSRVATIYFCIALIGSNLGFLYHNFNPAKIYMGDTGSMFLGYSVAVISIVGLFKNVTLLSFVIPVVVLAVPIFDTLFAMARRKLQGEKIMQPDKKHIHYQLLAAGFSHRKTVLLIYAFSAVFGALAVLFSFASIEIAIVILVLLLVMLHLLAEIVGAVRNGRRPLLSTLRKTYRKMVKNSSKGE